ncbi:MAG: hypothetical protein OXG16_13910 [Rhodospirillales bacterium]|nr:hypothetical protein [Rhodospirillales bacterium]
MRRLLVSGFALLLVAGCAGGGVGVVDGLVPEREHDPVREVSLSTTGEYRLSQIDVNGDAVTAVFHNWGVWGGILRDDVATCAAIGCPPGGDEIFWATLTSEGDGTVAAMVTGTPSGTSPVSGSAKWRGDVHGYETDTVATSETTSVTTHAPVEGDARLEVDFTAATVDVEFTNLDNYQADLSWSALTMDGGAFGNAAAGIEGSFYGADHEGAAGTFKMDGIAGVFGVLRASE